MSRLGITDLVGFEPFVNLEVLWLGKNNLTVIDGLDDCPRIRELHVDDNRLTTLEGSLAAFKFLHVLSVANNRLTNLAAVLGHLRRNSYLTSLDMSGNPAAEEAEYRAQVVAVLPSLEVLDNRRVTREDRIAAAALRRRRVARAKPSRARARPPAGAHARRAAAQRPQSPSDGPALSGCARLLVREAESVRRRRARAAEAERLAVFGGGQRRRAESAGGRATEEWGAGASLPRPSAAKPLSARERATVWWTSTLREVFQRHDADNNGALSASELVQVLVEMRDHGFAVEGGKSLREAAEELVSVLSTDGDREVSFEELLRGMQSGARAATPSGTRTAAPLQLLATALENAADRARELYETADRLRERAAAIEATEPDSARALGAQAMQAAQTAMRLEAQAGTQAAVPAVRTRKTVQAEASKKRGNAGRQAPGDALWRFSWSRVDVAERMPRDSKHVLRRAGRVATMGDARREAVPLLSTGSG